MKSVTRRLGELGEMYHLLLAGRVATVAVPPTKRAAVFGVFGRIGSGQRLQTNRSVMLRSIWSGRRHIGETELSALLCESPLFAVEQSIYDARIIEPFVRLLTGIGDSDVNLAQFRMRSAEGPLCDVLVVDCERWFFILAPIEVDRTAPLLVLRRTA